MSHPNAAFRKLGPACSVGALGAASAAMMAPGAPTGQLFAAAVILFTVAGPALLFGYRDDFLVRFSRPRTAADIMITEERSRVRLRVILRSAP